MKDMYVKAKGKLGKMKICYRFCQVDDRSGHLTSLRRREHIQLVCSCSDWYAIGMQDEVKPFDFLCEHVQYICSCSDRYTKGLRYSHDSVGEVSVCFLLLCGLSSQNATTCFAIHVCKKLLKLVIVGVPCALRVLGRTMSNLFTFEVQLSLLLLVKTGSA
ncbi:hypothetical protein RJ641_016261 [Dillenia turbinata]|uniref:Uncharacterized protein n=1 Tax=Dillenia turbinata TaxID=194707 RepID=A0AAN8Z101_9MAGN